MFSVKDKLLQTFPFLCLLNVQTEKVFLSNTPYLHTENTQNISHDLVAQDENLTFCSEAFMETLLGFHPMMKDLIIRH